MPIQQTFGQVISSAQSLVFGAAYWDRLDARPRRRATSYHSPMAKPVEVLRFLARSSKRIAVTIVGGVLLVGGLAMLVLPGPGILVVAFGFAVLGTEYAWAAAALERTKDTAARAGRAARSGVKRVTRR